VGRSEKRFRLAPEHQDLHPEIHHNEEAGGGGSGLWQEEGRPLRPFPLQFEAGPRIQGEVLHGGEREVENALFRRDTPITQLLGEQPPRGDSSTNEKKEKTIGKKTFSLL